MLIRICEIALYNGGELCPSRNNFNRVWRNSYFAPPINSDWGGRKSYFAPSPNNSIWIKERRKI